MNVLGVLNARVDELEEQNRRLKRERDEAQQMAQDALCELRSLTERLERLAKEWR